MGGLPKKEGGGGLRQFAYLKGSSARKKGVVFFRRRLIPQCTSCLKEWGRCKYRLPPPHTKIFEQKQPLTCFFSSRKMLPFPLADELQIQILYIVSAGFDGTMIFFKKSTSFIQSFLLFTLQRLSDLPSTKYKCLTKRRNHVLSLRFSH